MSISAGHLEQELLNRKNMKKSIDLMSKLEDHGEFLLDLAIEQAKKKNKLTPELLKEFNHLANVITYVSSMKAQAINGPVSLAKSEV